MKLHLMTIGRPRLEYAQRGWQEYFKRLGKFHTVRVTHLADKYADDGQAILNAAGSASIIALVMDGRQLDSQGLAGFLDKQALAGRELCFIIGGPEGLPRQVIDRADFGWSLSRLTFPHDLAMVVMVEALYRASTISAGHPYHRA